MEPEITSGILDAAYYPAAGIFLPIKVSPNFTALWLGQTLSQLGNAVLWVTLPLAVFDTSQSTLQMGLIMGLFMLPQVILLPFTGIVADRVSRTRLMISTDAIRLVLVSVVAVLFALHKAPLSILQLFVLLYGIMEALFQPAYAAVRAQVFLPDIRNAAISLTQMSQQVSKLLGPALGGLLVGFGSPAAGFALDAFMLLISLVSLTRLRLSGLLPPEGGLGLRGFLIEFRGGYVELKKHPWLWITILAFAFLSIAGTGLTTILVPWLMKVHLHLSDTSYGMVSSAAGIGAIAAAYIYGRRSRWRHRAFIAYGGLAGQAVTLFVASFVHTTLLLMVLMAVDSAFLMLFGVVWEASLQELVPPEAYGRVASLDFFGSWVLLPVGNVFTGWFAATVGGIPAIWVEAAFMLLITVVTLGVPAVRQYD